MGKVIFWIVVVFAVLFGAAAPQRRQGEATARDAAAPQGGDAARQGAAMVRCARCGVFLPQADARADRAASSAATPAAPQRTLTDPRLCSDNLLRACSPAPPSRRSSRRCRRRSGDSSRRILRIVGLYRAICGAIAARHRAAARPAARSTIAAPNAFVTAAALYFLFGLAAFWWIQRDPLPLPLPRRSSSALLVGDIFFLALVMIAGGSSGGPLPILLFPQLAASGWLLRTRTAFFHAALATRGLLGLDVWRLLEGQVGGAQPFQTGLIGFGYFATIGIAVALGRYTKASEDLAAQRGIDVANLEQVNRLIIQDMQDGVLVVDLNGIVRSHNAQVTRLLGGYGRMRGGMRLAEFSLDAGRLLAALAGGPFRSRCRRSRSSRRSGCCACGWCGSARGSTAAR